MSKLTHSTLAELMDAGRLPSGRRFVLAPDTIEIAMQVGEADHRDEWQLKLLQVSSMVDSIENTSISYGPEGATLLKSTLDTDVAFIALAWIAAAQGMALALDGNVDCPACGAAITEIPLGGIIVSARDQPASGSDAIIPLEVDERLRKRLPEAVRDRDFFMRDPTWAASRSHIKNGKLSDRTTVETHRVLAGLMWDANGSTISVPRSMSVKFPVRFIRLGMEAISKHVPTIANMLSFKCSKCNSSIDVPFDPGALGKPDYT